MQGRKLTDLPNSPIDRRELLFGMAGALALPPNHRFLNDKPVVLTFDDAVKSHRTFVGPLLKELGFGATFFVTHRWMADSANFMTWEEIAELHRMGFEIGNHSWTHAGFNTPLAASHLEAELALVDYALERVKVPRPISFAWCGNAFGPESVEVLRKRGIRFARRGMQPEVKYGAMKPGPLFDPRLHNPLLIPTSGDAYPNWTLEHFKRVVSRTSKNRIVLLQFHGVPDIAHPWVHTPPERFREYMLWLRESGFRGLALRDLEPRVDRLRKWNDSAAATRYPAVQGSLPTPIEAKATRDNLKPWLENMLFDHGYTHEEAGIVAGIPAMEVTRKIYQFKLAEPNPADHEAVKIRPYPGGRHPRIGFLDGAVSPMRGTKASVFVPWDSTGYVVVDLPEAIFSNLGLTFLAHTHIATIWDEKNQWIENIDWKCEPDGELRSEWNLPNGIAFGAALKPELSQVNMKLWLRNGTENPLTGLRTQICLMLKAAPGFNEQTAANKRFEGSVAAVRSDSNDRWILTAWERCGRVWGNPPCPCIHSDPILPDCAPGKTVVVSGSLAFYEGDSINGEIARLQRLVSNSVGSHSAVSHLRG